VTLDVATQAERGEYACRHHRDREADSEAQHKEEAEAELL
jgi:hypothetical protein